MTKTIVNLATSIVVQEAEAILETYPYRPYQQAFAEPELKRRLTTYVLSRVPGVYVVINQSETASSTIKTSLVTLDRQHQIESLIHQGIQKILSETSTNPTVESRG
ncbi:MAG TPA: hypothetical protein V6C65_11395 [Allocoleopsis sp.]